MMKRITLKLIALIVVFTACNDAIDINQVGRLGADKAFETPTDLEQGLLSVYNRLDNSSMVQFNAIFTDELAIGFDNGGQGLGDGTYGFNLTATSTFPSSHWTRHYFALNAANRIIDAEPNIPRESAEDIATIDDILGQAYAIRALCHFNLLTYFSEDLRDNNSKGVIILDFVPQVSQSLARATTGEVFTSINSDLTLAEGLIEDQNNTTFISLDFITALRARIETYRGNYTTADTHAANLIGSGRYSLADPTQYANMYLDTDNTEIIFKLERTTGDTYDGQGSTGSAAAGGWMGANFAFQSATVNGSPYFEMSRSLFNLLDPADVRYSVLVGPDSKIDPDYLTNNVPADDILVVYKYPGSEGQPLMNDHKVFRLSEMYLIRAEAAISNNDLPAAAGFIDNIRDARYGADQLAPVYANAAAAYAGLLEERRIELAYEGHRYVDLARLQTLAGVAIDRDPIDCEINGQCILDASSHKWIVPIPQGERDANPAMEQSTGY